MPQKTKAGENPGLVRERTRRCLLELVLDVDGATALDLHVVDRADARERPDPAPRRPYASGAERAP